MTSDGIKLFLFEPDEPTAQKISKNLQASGLQCQLCWTSELSSLEKDIQRERPDLLIVSLKAPDKDCHTIMKKLCSLKPHLPVIGLVEKGDDAAVREAFRAGVQDCFSEEDFQDVNLLRLLYFVSEWKRLKGALDESEDKFRSVADAVPIMLWIVDETEQCAFVNRAWHDFTGLNLEKSLGAGWLDSLHPDDRQGFCRDLEDALSGQQELASVKRLRGSAGDYHWVKMTGVLKKQVDGPGFQFIGTGMDVSEMKRAEEMKDEFVSTVSHELRTPLTIIRESVSQLDEGLLGELTEPQKKYLQMSLSNIDRLARIIDDILDISKLDASRLQLRREMIDVFQMMEEVYENFSPQAALKNLDFKLDFPNKKIFMIGDRDKLIQVWSNLLVNALKFTDTGSITLGVRESDLAFHFSVIDTGIGIAETDLPKVFDKFQQIGREDGPGDKGTGLGLAITKGIVELHGGDIQIESLLDKGSKFSFEIPRIESRDVFVDNVLVGMRDAQENRKPFSIVVYNRHSHKALQQILQGDYLEFISKLSFDMRSKVRRGMDILILLQDIFAVLLPRTDRINAHRAAERINRHLKAAIPNHISTDLFDGGFEIITYPEDIQSGEELAQRLGW